MRTGISGATAILLSVAALTAAGQSPSPAVPKPVVVTLDDNYPPYSFRDASGALQGIRKDTWDLWSRKTGIPVRLDAKDWGEALAQMAEGNADVIDTIFRTPERERLYDLSAPYVTIEVPIYFDGNIGGITDVASLRGFTVGVKDGDACIDRLLAGNVLTLKKYSSYEALVRSAAARDVRVFCMDAPPANYFLYKQGIDAEFRRTAPLYYGQFHWAVKKGRAALLNQVMEGFGRVTASELREIDERWLGRPVGDARVAKYGANILLAAVGIALGLVLWNWSLRQRVTTRTRELSASKEHFEALMSTTPVGVFETDAAGAGIYVNDRWLQIAGLSREQALGDGWMVALREDQREEVRGEWRQAVREGRSFEREICLHRADGSEVWILAQVHPMRDERGTITGYIGSTTDITERRLAETRIAFLAHHDPLTELPNRLLARDRAGIAMALADRSRQKLAMLFLDLDNFKTINDSLGHTSGDALLKAIAARLRDCVRDTDTISRQGGDEFLVLMPEMGGPDAVAAAASKIVEIMSRPVEVNGQELAVSVSVGVALYPDDGTEFDTLLKKADTAMYQAKEAGRNTYRFFTDHMNVDALERLRIQSGLRRGLDRGEFILHFQPQVRIADGRVVGAEALVRWNHSELGLLGPNRFIPVAEMSGAIIPMSDWILGEACRQAVSWHRSGYPGLAVAVNLSAVQFRRGDLQGSVLAAIRESGIDPACLELELTESIMIGDTEGVLEVVRQLKILGVRLSIDDFGTGYSSLSYLKRFPVDKLKIDRSFVRDMVDGADDATIVRAIIQLAHALNLKTVAEGVENEEIVRRLRALRCEEAQGYHFGRPMPGDEFLDYLAGARARGAVPAG